MKWNMGLSSEERSDCTPKRVFVVDVDKPVASSVSPTGNFGGLVNRWSVGAVGLGWEIPMAKIKTRYECSDCGYVTPKWMGKCPKCKAWNTLTEGVERQRTAAPSLSDSDRPVALSDVSLDRGGEVRVRTGIGELDTVLGGGLVTGSLVLLGGDPGVGKSTLLLMAADRFAAKGVPVLYVSGEESLRQIRLRAQRLGICGDLKLLAHTDFPHISAIIEKDKPHVVVLDSVQTLNVPEVGSVSGSQSQVREVAHRAMLLAKRTNTAIFLVGHITKSGDLAGPKVLEHFVDTVLHFEGDGRSPLRVLRSVKNRFGPAGELGMFEMVDAGLREVPDASARLLAERAAGAEGTAVVASLEGTRPLLCEVQALVGRPTPAIPGRTCVGVDRTRVLMLAAVLEKAGMSVFDRDIFVNAAGGVRLHEPAADLGILAAVASSLAGQPVRNDTMLFGEVGLVGEIRSVSHPALRLKEAARHGFSRVVAPRSALEHAPPHINVIGVQTVRDALAALF
jgi:DNA repair protein RadA/Sms